MTLTLDAATERLLQRELARGRFADANELIAHALLLVEAEQNTPAPAEMEDWLLRNKDAIRAALEVSSAQAARGEGYSPEESRALLEQHRARRKARAA